MTYLMVQTSLLMLAAFFLGALLACVARTALSGRGPRAERVASGEGEGARAGPGAFTDPPGAAAGAHAMSVPLSAGDRFERALSQPGTRPPSARAFTYADPAPAGAPPPRPSRVPTPFPPDGLKVTVSTPVSTSEPEPAEVAAAAAAAAAKIGAAAPEARRPAAAPSPPPEQPARPVEPLRSAQRPPAAPPPAAEASVQLAPASAFPAAGGPSAPAAVAADVRVLPDDAPGDDLTCIRGIDRALKARLNGLGVRRFQEIAAWTTSDVRRFSRALNLRGRIERENWIEQANILAKGGQTAYSRRKADGEAPLAVPPTGMREQGAASGVAVRVVVEEPPAPAPATDRLQSIRGIDADAERMLRAAGITRYEQIAGWSSSDVRQFEDRLGARGRIARENWIEQAQVLAKGGQTAYSRSLERQKVAEAGPARPAKLADAIRERSSRQSADGHGSGADLAGMRSVRSAAYGGSKGAGDDLKRIRGIGVLLEKKLNSLGVTRYEDIANWSAADIERVSQVLDFKGRIERENWVEQARILASGGHTEFSRRIDKGA